MTAKNNENRCITVYLPLHIGFDFDYGLAAQTAQLSDDLHIILHYLRGEWGGGGEGGREGEEVIRREGTGIR